MTRYRLIFFVALFAIGFAQSGSAAWLVRQERQGDRVRVLSVRPSSVQTSSDQKVLRSIPWALREDAKTSKIFEEILYSDSALPESLERLAESLDRTDPAPKFESTEVRTLVSQGPKENRINLTILGDGYTLAEKERFFADAARITQNLFNGQTFASYLALFNVYAVFVSSKDSGLTDGAIKKNTAFSLYRDPPGSKRAIMPGNPRALEAALELAPATDYPIVLANDNYYGGLGGRYAISTRSEESGMIVLRHELGHNFGEVGEEYDSGYVYSGANSSETSDVSWAHWLTPGQPKAFETLFLSGEYVWQNLARGDFSSEFEFPAPTEEGPYQFEIIVSSVGWSTPEEVSVELDGQKMALEGKWTKDRSFFTFVLPQSPAPGKHKLTVHQNINDGDNIIAFATIFALPTSLKADVETYGAFATYDADGNKFYRPTHRYCLMRDMKYANFCSVDRENMWVRFLDRVNLIDDLKYDRTTKKVELVTPALPNLSIRWFKVEANGRESELPALEGKHDWVQDGSVTGTVRAKVGFRTTEVRKTTSRFDQSKDVSL